VRRLKLSLPVVDEDGRWAAITPAAIALGRYSLVGRRERGFIPRVLLRMRGLDPDEHDGETFADVLRRLGQSETMIDRFWDVFIRPGLNLRSREVSAAPALFTVQTALLSGRRASELILPVRPLGRMHGDAARRALEAAGAAVVTGARVDGLDELDADVVVLAAGPADSARLLDEAEPELEGSPIVSVHLLFDRRILHRPLAALLGSDAHWVFDRGALVGEEQGNGQYLTVVSSGVPELLEVRGRELVEHIAAELTGRLGPAKLQWSRVSREPHATVALRPGTASARPGPATGKPGVVRAGAWTGTGWPATMEGAVRSGRAAARLLLSDVTTMVSA
jgi:hypothetical protein